MESNLTKFWIEIYDKNGELKSLKIDNTFLLDFLGQVGLKKYRINQVADSVWVHKDGRFWSIVNDETVKDVAIKKIKTAFSANPNIHGVINKLNGVNNIFKRGFLTGLRTIEIESVIDTQNTSYNYYKDGVLIVDNKGMITAKSYDDVKGDIWKSTVIDRTQPHLITDKICAHELYSQVCFNGSETELSVIDQFLKKITIDDRTYQSVKSSLGYLMHRYKSESVTKLISLTDTDFDADASGGNGKTLIAKILGKVRNTHTINHDVAGKMKEFVFANVTSDMDIVFHDELPSGFKLRRLFTVVTGDLTTEKKGKDVNAIPFAIAPKHLSASNHPFEGTGGSFSGRLHEIQINHHYERSRLQPINEFGDEFFSTNWSPNEWIKFDAFMLSCVALFLKKGLISATNSTIKESKLILNTNENFCLFMEDLDIGSGGAMFTAKKLIEEFLVAQDNIKALNTNTAIKWLKEWGSVKKLDLNKKREGGGDRRRFITLGNGDTDVWAEFTPF